MLHQQIKQSIPPVVRRRLGSVYDYLQRLKRCSEIACNISGVSSEDKSTLRAALFASPVDMLRGLSSWRDLRVGKDAFVSVDGLGYFHIRGGSDDLGHLTPSLGRALRNVLAASLRPGDIAIDAGANIGSISVSMAKNVTDSGRVIAIEMMPDTASYLRRNLLANKLNWVEVIELALSDAVGKTVIAAVPDGFFGQASIVRLSDEKPVLRHQIATTTFDAITADIGKVALIKLDLEGAEPLALAGARETLRKTKCVVFESSEAGGGEAGQILREHGFLIEPVDGLNFCASRAHK